MIRELNILKFTIFKTRKIRADLLKVIKKCNNVITMYF